MRTLLTIIALTATCSAYAQESSGLPPLPPGQSAPAPTPDPNAGKQIYGQQTLFEVVDTVPYEPRWRMDLLLGAPTGLRFQRQIAESRYWFEIGGGAYLWWPAVFAGIRSEGRMIATSADILSVRPGLIAYYLPGYSVHDEGRNRRWSFDDYDYRVRTAGMLALDFDLSWKHRWTNAFHSEIALKLGVGVLATSRYVDVAPLAGLSLGFNY